MRYYPAKVVGVRYEGRDRYVKKNVRVGDSLTFQVESNNPHDPGAVAVFHARTKVGYVPSDRRWIRDSIAEGDSHEITVTEFVENDEGQLAVIGIRVGIEDVPYEPPPPSPRQQTLSELSSELLVLVLVAKSDSRLSRSERDLIVRYAQERAADKELAFDSEVATYVDNWIKRQDPTEVQVELHLRELAGKDQAALEALFEVCQLVVEIDGKIVDSEVQRLTGVTDLIRRLIDR
jgi:hypothetical protein